MMMVVVMVEVMMNMTITILAVSSLLCTDIHALNKVYAFSCILLIKALGGRS